MRILGLDLGARRIGTALSDADGAIAFPHGAIDRQDRKKDLESLQALIQEEKVGHIVVGLPVHMDGRVGPEAQAAQTFARVLAETTGIPVDVLDERWTPREAERALRESSPARGRSRRREKTRRERVDALAAALILRTFLARRATETGETEER